MLMSSLLRYFINQLILSVTATVELCGIWGFLVADGIKGAKGYTMKYLVYQVIFTALKSAIF